jgi:hypothetical protein
MSEQQLPLIDIVPDKSIPPKVLKRNSYGLLEGFPYLYQEDGNINWKGIVDPKFLYVNSDTRRRSKLETKYNKKFEEIDIIKDKVEDVDLVIKLGGIKSLLRIRGYESVFYTISNSDQSYAAVKCSIDFIANFESENRPINFCDNACATPENANGFGSKYLLEIATNRSFCRCVRNFLNINIVSQDELGGDTNEFNKENTPSDDFIILKRLMEQHGITFEKIKEKLIKEGKNPGAENYNSINDIPRFKVLELNTRIERKAAEKEKI